MKKLLIAVLIAAVAAAGCFAAVMAAKSKKLDTFMETLQLHEVDLKKIADGVYTGEADAGMILVIAEVTVQNHAITGIDLLKHKNGQGAAAESITGRIVQAQAIAVDAVSGATLSSRVIQKAVETALTDGAP